MADAVQRYNAAEARSTESGPGIVTRRALLEGGDTLVFKLGNMPTGNTTFDPYAMRKSLRPELCDDAGLRELVEQGVKVRFDITSNYGKELPYIQFTRCD